MGDTVESLKTVILSMLKQKGDGLSFVNLSTIPGFEGNLGMERGNKNVFFWFRCSAEAVAAVGALIDEKQIKLSAILPLTYHADGCVPQYPIGDLNGIYKKPHWCPVRIAKGEAFGR